MDNPIAIFIISFLKDAYIIILSFLSFAADTNFTIANLKVVKVNSEENILMVKGAVPGSVNSIVELLKN